MKNFFEEIKDCNEKEAKLKTLFNKIEELHEERHDIDILDYDEYFREVNEIEKEKNTLRIKNFIGLIKANIYLRKGECIESKFKIEEKEGNRKSIKKYYDLAFHELRNCIEVESKDLDLLIHISLGRYFRDMGHIEKRSNFDRAIYEFEKVKKELESKQEKFNKQKTYMWLEAQVNIGRAYKNLYKLEDAESCFYEMFNKLGEKIKFELNSDAKINRINKEDNKEELDIIFKTENLNEAIYEDKLFVEDELYRSYITQAFIQLIILCRKRRNYKQAQYLSEKLLNIDAGNIDAQNNLGICLRKQGEYEEAKKIFLAVKDGNNRFAKINYYKCLLKEIEQDSKKRKTYKNEIKEFFDWGEENDVEFQFLKGCFLKKFGKVKKAYRIFKKLYKKFPYLEDGTIGLKIYYNMAKCLMIEGKYEKASKKLEDILVVCENDILARIDKGWCMMKMNQYAAAKKIYEELIRFDKIETLKEKMLSLKIELFEKIKILNNFGECFLRMGEIENAEKTFKIVKEFEPWNIVARKCLAECYIFNGEKLRKEGLEWKKQEKLEKAKECFIKARKYYKQANEELENVLKEKNDDFWLLSNLIIIKRIYIKICEEVENEEINDEEEKPLKAYEDWIINRLLYYPELKYYQMACRELAEWIITDLEKIEDENKMKMLYFAFSKIHLIEQEEGYVEFSNFMNSEAYRTINLEKRGKILAYLFLIYGGVRQIKEVCRYSPKILDESEKKEVLPVHYTSIETLKLLLKDVNKKEEQPRLRLWNSIYMNDPYEGVVFLKMLKKIKDNDNSLEQVLQECFSHIYENEKIILPRNRNVYITSFSKKIDELFMWAAYGSQGKGCNITFADDFFDIRSRTEGIMGNPIYLDKDYALYRILYVEEIKEQDNNIKMKIVNLDKAEDIKKVEDGINTICTYIRKLSVFLEKEEEKKVLDNNKKKVIYDFIANALNEVRFLFKDCEFKGEEEMRLVQYSSKPKYDENYPIPRMYINVEKDIQIESVRIGPKNNSQEIDKLYSWLYSTEKVNEVVKSERHFQ